MSPAQKTQAAIVQAKAAATLSGLFFAGIPFAFYLGGWLHAAGAALIWLAVTLAKPPRPEL